MAGRTKKPLEMPAEEQLCQSGEQRPVGRLERRPVDLAPEDRHLVTEHDDFDRQVRVNLPRLTRHLRPTEIGRG